MREFVWCQKCTAFPRNSILPEIHIQAHPAPPTGGRCIWIPHYLLFDFWTFFFFSAVSLRGKRTAVEITTHFPAPNSLLFLLAHRTQRTLTFTFFYAEVLRYSASNSYIKFPFSVKNIFSFFFSSLHWRPVRTIIAHITRRQPTIKGKGTKFSKWINYDGLLLSAHELVYRMKWNYVC